MTSSDTASSMMAAFWHFEMTLVNVFAKEAACLGSADKGATILTTIEVTENALLCVSAVSAAVYRGFGGDKTA